MNSSFNKKTKKGSPPSSLQHAVKRNRKMRMDSNHCENSGVYCTIQDCLVLKELQFPSMCKLQMRSWTETVLRTWGAWTNLVICTC